jgi:hypothetical protein
VLHERGEKASVLSRRAFLRLLGIAAATPLLPTQVWSLHEPVLAPDIVPVLAGELSQPMSLQWVVAEALRQIETRVTRTFQHVDAHHLGDAGLAHQIWAHVPDLNMITSPEAYRQRIIAPFAAHFAQRLHDERWTICGRLPLPLNQGYHTADVFSPQSGLALRAVCGYDVGRDRELLRIDMIGG